MKEAPSSVTLENDRNYRLRDFLPKPALHRLGERWQQAELAETVGRGFRFTSETPHGNELNLYVILEHGKVELMVSRKGKLSASSIIQLGEVQSFRLGRNLIEFYDKKLVYRIEFGDGHVVYPRGQEYSHKSFVRLHF